MFIEYRKEMKILFDNIAQLVSMCNTRIILFLACPELRKEVNSKTTNRNNCFTFMGGYLMKGYPLLLS